MCQTEYHTPTPYPAIHNLFLPALGVGTKVPTLHRAAGKTCARCGGSGRLRCSSCGGTGQSSFSRLCVACNGQSRITCSSCWGSGRG